MPTLLGRSLVADGLLVQDTVGAGSGAGALEEGVNLRRELAIIRHATVVSLGLLGSTSSLNSLPLSAHVLNLGLPVRLGIIRLANATESLPEGQVVGVDGNTMVLVGLAVTDVAPSSLLLLEVETSGVGEEKPGQEHASKAEPWDDVESGLDVDVVVQNRSKQSTGLSKTGRETVGSSSDGGGENLTGNEESDGVGAELVEEGGQEVHGLESVDTLGAGVVLVLERGDDEHEEAHEETNLLHPLTAVELVVDEESGAVVTSQGDDNVDQAPRPGGQEGVGVVGDDLDELALEELVAVEENVVAEPGTGGGEETATEVSKARLEGGNIITGDAGAALGLGKLLRGVGHLPSSVVDEPQSANGREGEGQTESELSSLLGVRGAALAVVEDDEQDNEQNLVDELTPTLHQESHGDTATTMQTILLGGELTSSDGALEGRSGSDGIFTADTERVEEQRPGVANNPALERVAPAGSEHEETDEHDDGILNETPATANPITNNLYRENLLASCVFLVF